MSSEPDDEEQNTRPVSVAELLARNGTIGAPPAGGRRRRRRGNSAAVTVAELTGEIPVIRDEPAPAGPAPVDPAPAGPAPVDTEPAAAGEPEPEPEPEPEIEPEIETGAAETGADAVVIEGEAADATMVIVGVGAVEADEAEADGAEGVEEADDVDEAEPVGEAEPVDQARPVAADDPVEAARRPESPPPLASDPRPRRGGGPELSHDPRPVRRSSGAEQMAFDPVDQSVDLSDLVGDQAAEEEELRSYLKSSGGPLFSGETVADDLARRGLRDEDREDREDDDLPAARVAPAPGGRLAALRAGLVALAQSVLAVIFGAGLFLAFDQLWRWNTIVALVLSVLVILGLVIAVRVVRRTEDIASTLIAVAVGALVTLGPLALLQSYG